MLSKKFKKSNLSKKSYRNQTEKYFIDMKIRLCFLFYKNLNYNYGSVFKIKKNRGYD